MTDDVIRLLIPQRLLGTWGRGQEVMVIHHTNCGMMSFSDDGLERQVQTETGIKPPFALEAFLDLDEDVCQSMARIRTSPFVPRRDAVRGFVYDVGTGALREVGA